MGSSVMVQLQTASCGELHAGRWGASHVHSQWHCWVVDTSRVGGLWRNICLARVPKLVAETPPNICHWLHISLWSSCFPFCTHHDRRTSIDVVIIRESLQTTCCSVRWLPTNRMLADGRTKDKMDPVDLLRSCIRTGQYQISPEELVLQQHTQERERRKQRQAGVQVDQKGSGLKCSVY